MCMVSFDWKKADATKKFKHFDETRGLSWAVFEVTEACNLNCKWCYASSGGKVVGKHMPLKKAMEVVDKLRDAGAKQITFSGGEPLIYPGLSELAAYAHSKGFVVHVNTNGFALTESLAMKLADAGVTQVQMNVDSLDPQEHDLVRGKSGSHARVIDAFKNASEAGMTTAMQTVLTRENENKIEGIFELALSMGVDRSRVWDMSLSGAASSQSDNTPTDYVKSLLKLTEFAKDHGVVNIESGDPLFPGGLDLGVPVTGGFCVTKHGLITNIGVDGGVMPCVTQRKAIMNIFDCDDFAEEYKLALDRFMADYNVTKHCESCDRISACSGGCIIRRKVNSGLDYFCGRLKENMA